MLSKTFTITPILDDDYIVASVTPGTGALTLLQTTLSPAHRVAVVFGGDSGKTLTIVGTDTRGLPLTEVVTSAGAGTVTTTRYFASITSITPSAAYASTVKVGLSGLAVTPWYPLDHKQASFHVSIMVDVSGTCIYSVEHTLNEIQNTSNTLLVGENVGLTNKTADASGSYCTPVSAIRAKITSYTSGSLDLHIRQAG